jgi:hypothetical protein
MVFLQGSRRDLVSVRRKMLEKREEYSVGSLVVIFLTEVNLVLVVLVL